MRQRLWNTRVSVEDADQAALDFPSADREARPVVGETMEGRRCVGTSVSWVPPRLFVPSPQRPRFPPAWVRTRGTEEPGPTLYTGTRYRLTEPRQRCATLRIDLGCRSPRRSPRPHATTTVATARIPPFKVDGECYGAYLPNGGSAVPWHGVLYDVVCNRSRSCGCGLYN